MTKLKLKNGCDEHIPSLTQWLQVVGLGKGSIMGLCQKISSVEELQEKSEHELRTILNDKGARPEELSRLCRALHNLKRYTGMCSCFCFVERKMCNYILKIPLLYLLQPYPIN